MMSIIGDVVLPVSLTFIMYGIGLSLKLEDFQRVLIRRYPITMGVISMMLITPLLGVLMAIYFSPSPLLAVGIVLLATCPGGMLSNLMTDLAGGDLALSVSMTVMVSIVYVFLIPFVANGAVNYFVGDTHVIELEVLPVFLKIALITLLPVLLGMLTRRKFLEFAIKARPIIKKVATLFLVIAFIFIVASQWDVVAKNINRLVMIVVIMNALAVGVAYSISRIGRLSKEETIAVCVEHSIRQEGTAIFIAITLLNSHEMAIPMILNTPVGMFVCVSFVLFLRRKKTSEAVN